MKIKLSVQILQLFFFFFFTGHEHINTPAGPYIQYVCAVKVTSLVRGTPLLVGAIKMAAKEEVM